MTPIIIDPSEPRETRQQRLLRLKAYLAAELVEDDPSPLYIKDLEESIKDLEGNKK